MYGRAGKSAAEATVVPNKMPMMAVQGYSRELAMRAPNMPLARTSKPGPRLTLAKPDQTRPQRPKCKYYRNMSVMVDAALSGTSAAAQDADFSSIVLIG